ncbi:DUF3617 domain-containing protein [Rhodoferax sp.]|uniref:DUF3617 domain-containing protein n=1 Tax=Rhodoferax sp. TaxID=50421 RepID=UPI001EBDA96C|nr:DUF3617 domain-containing protein [Rhodoferax sp.]MBT9508004.1 DUF3617 domain-containing protein [Rhodoferax sp.]
MNKLHHVLLAAALASSAFGATAQTMKPGLWEISNKMTSSSGEMEKAMGEAQKQLAGMSPSDRKMMEDMMAKQGVGMGKGAGTTAMKICMTKEMAERNEVATQQGDCKHTNSPRAGNTMKFSFVCAKPPSSGEGQVTFVSPEAYAMKMTLNTTANGKPEKMNMDATGKFMSTDCGNIKPISMPKK